MMVATPVERSLVLVKPDGVKRSLIGEIVRRIEAKGMRVVAMDLRSLPRELVEEHYAEHEGKPFYPELVEFITSGPVVAMVLEGPSAVSTVRTMMGATNPLDSAPGTIRGDYALEIGENAVHGSDSVDSAEREIAIYFTEDELV